MTPPCCSPAVVRLSRTVLVAALALAAAALAPLAARSQELEPMPAPAPQLVAEALFLCDALPPGGRDVNLIVAVEQSDPDPDTGASRLLTSPRLQLAMALSDRVGLTVDVGLGDEGGVPLHTPGASLKLLLRAPDASTTGLAASLDLYGPTRAAAETEAGVGLGAIRGFGRFALRAGASVATPVAAWAPHLHGGVSGAVALGSRWRALCETVAEVAGGDVMVSAGPTVKVQLAERTALMAGALFPVSDGLGAPAFTFQLTQSM